MQGKSRIWINNFNILFDFDFVVKIENLFNKLILSFFFSFIYSSISTNQHHNAPILLQAKHLVDRLGQLEIVKQIIVILFHLNMLYHPECFWSFDV